MDREAWRAAVHGVTKSQTRLSVHVPLLGPAHRKLPHLHSMCPSFPAAAIQMVSKPTLETLPASVLWELIEEGPLPSCMSPSKAK